MGSLLEKLQNRLFWDEIVGVVNRVYTGNVGNKHKLLDLLNKFKGIS